MPLKGEQPSVVSRQLFEWQLRQRHKARRRLQLVHVFCSKTNVAIGEPEPGLLIIGLLGDYAVQADVTRAEITHRRLPQLDSVTFAAKLRSDDVKADEAEFLSISDRRNAAHRRTGNFADEEPLRVGGVKALCIMQAGIPTFRRRPVRQQLHFLRRDIADLHCFRQCSRSLHSCQQQANRVLRVAVR